MLLKEYGKAKSRIVAAFGLEPGSNAYPDTNGEYAFLRFARALPEAARGDSIIDVGANRGDWTAEARAAFAGGAISRFVCVEPVPSFLAQLRKRYENAQDVEIFDVGLSSGPETEAEIFEIAGGGRMYRDYRGSSGNAVETKAATTKTTVAHKIRISSGDALARQANIRPYLLKIDCDGHDGHILEGFRETLVKHRPLVQFEYCDFWIGAGSRLRDACRLLNGAGYNTFKMFPDRLKRFNFNPLFETFGYQNIIAAPKEFASLSAKTVEFRA